MKKGLSSINGEYSGDPKRIEGACFCKSDFSMMEVLPNKCIENSYNFAIIKSGKMVEGLLLMLIEGKVDSIEPHCWNKIGEDYYDVTVDKLHNSAEYKQKIGDKEISLIYLGCVEYLPAESGYNSELSTFYYNYDSLFDYVKKSIQQTE